MTPSSIQRYALDQVSWTKCKDDGRGVYADKSVKVGFDNTLDNTETDIIAQIDFLSYETRKAGEMSFDTAVLSR